jgi:hypothetical protein
MGVIAQASAREERSSGRRQIRAAKNLGFVCRVLGVKKSAYCSHECAAEYGAFTGRPRMYSRDSDALGEFHIHNGYKTRYEPDHPKAQKSGSIYEHIKVIYQAGIEVPNGYHVDHINSDKWDNRLENLQVLSPSEHAKKTSSERLQKFEDQKIEIEALRVEIAEYRRLYGPLPEGVLEVWKGKFYV